MWLGVDMACGAYYSEFDPYCAEWLRNLIKAGLIADGDVDERDVREVDAKELVGYTQCHFFAGISGWLRALRLAGWPDDRPVWTGSCPCPPFSAAGKKKSCPSCGGTHPVPHVGQTGYFVCCLCGHEWLADERHLWPEMWRLIRDGHPSVFFGEQVASADGRVWLASVRASLEILGYGVGGADMCAAGVGAPHIRQRLWIIALADSDRAGRFRGAKDAEPKARACTGEPGDCPTHLVGHASDTGLPPCECAPLEGAGRGEEGGAVEQSGGASDPLANISFIRGRARLCDSGQAEQWGDELADGRGDGRVAHLHECPHLGSEPRPEFGAVPEADGGVRALADPNGGLCDGRECEPEWEAEGRIADDRDSEVGNFWTPATWLPCRDGKWRPTAKEYGPIIAPLLPLVDGSAFRVGTGGPLEGKSRVGMLKAAGNAIVPPVAAQFIKAVMEVTDNGIANPQGPSVPLSQ